MTGLSDLKWGVFRAAWMSGSLQKFSIWVRDQFGVLFSVVSRGYLCILSSYLSTVNFGQSVIRCIRVSGRVESQNLHVVLGKVCILLL